MTTREKMIAAASYSSAGGFINTDGAWCGTRTPEEFKAHIESYGFTVTECKATSYSTAVAKTADGFCFAC